MKHPNQYGTGASTYGSTGSAYGSTGSAYGSTYRRRSLNGYSKREILAARAILAVARELGAFDDLD